MTVAVNPVRKDDNDAQIIFNALNLAKDVYRIRMDDKANERANALAAEARQNQANEDSAKEIRTFEKDYEQVPAGTKGSVSAAFPLPRGIKPPEGYTYRLRSAGEAERKMGQEAQTREFSQTNTLRDEYARKSTDTDKLVNAYSRIEPIFKNKNPTGATDLALIYGFNKILDPGSTIRESEFNNAQQTAGITDRALAFRDQILSGQKLTPEQRRSIEAEVKGIMAGQLEAQKEVDAEAAGKAHLYGLDKKKIIDERYDKLLSRLKKDTDAVGLVQSQKEGPSFDASKIDTSRLSPQAKTAAEILKARQAQRGTAGR